VWHHPRRHRSCAGSGPTPTRSAATGIAVAVTTAIDSTALPLGDRGGRPGGRSLAVRRDVKVNQKLEVVHRVIWLRYEFDAAPGLAHRHDATFTAARDDTFHAEGSAARVRGLRMQSISRHLAQVRDYHLRMTALAVPECSAALA
jgi:hypothetical protein